MPKHTDELNGFQAGTFRAALVWMPFARADRPSIQVGLLRAIAEQAGFACDSYHLNLDLAAQLPRDLYDRLCESRYHVLAEWLFSMAAFGAECFSRDADHLSAFPGLADLLADIGYSTDYLFNLRQEALPRYVEEQDAATEWGRYQVVGFSSTFQQNCACLALARRIKAHSPSTTIVFGGSNMEGEMGCEHLRAFPFIDYVVTGEGDAAFPDLLRCLASEQQAAEVPGVLARTDDLEVQSAKPPAAVVLDALPTPVYDEYFERLNGLEELSAREMVQLLPFESSRGCWWGQKHQCMFCGLNGPRLRFRSKKADKVLAELGELARKHRLTYFAATDNVLQPAYLNTFFPSVEANRLDFCFFYEVRADLSQHQIRTLSRGGVRWVQVGIESLSTRLLRLMNKGCTMLDNVRALKWLRYYQIRAQWNLLWGFPGETGEDYARQLEVLKLLTHLQPPVSTGRITLDRFSPYFSRHGEPPGMSIRPHGAYQHIYPDIVDVEKIAYYFESQMKGTLPDKAHTSMLDWIEEWRRRWQSDRRDTLYYRRTSDSLFVDDDRGPERRGSHAFFGPMALVYEHCVDTMRTVPQVAQHLALAPERYEYSHEQVREALELFCDRGLMVTEDGRYLALALPDNRNW